MERGRNIKSIGSVGVISIYLCAVMALLAVLPLPTAHGREPYFRTYGNDVVAGGGYGSFIGCTTATAEVLGFGAWLGAGPFNHSNYVGAGSELGVFAPDQIEGVLPGSSTANSRSGLAAPSSPAATPQGLAEFAFANSNGAFSVSAGPFQFGGGFGAAFCASDFPTGAGYTALIPADSGKSIGQLLSDYPAATGPDGIANFRVDFNSFALNGGTVPTGVSVRIFVSGDPLDTTNANPAINGNVGYQGSATGWNNASDIPYFELLSNGNINIDSNVSQIAGTFKARNNIYTCSQGANPLFADTRSPFGQDDLASLCSNKLTVFGNLTAQEVFFYRTPGDVAAAGVGNVGERYDGVNPLANVAEVAVFSPEVYLALLSRSATPTFSTDEIDSIRALPPAF